MCCLLSAVRLRTESRRAASYRREEWSSSRRAADIRARSAGSRHWARRCEQQRSQECARRLIEQAQGVVARARAHLVEPEGQAKERGDGNVEKAEGGGPEVLLTDDRNLRPRVERAPGCVGNPEIELDLINVSWYECDDTARSGAARLWRKVRKDVLGLARFELHVGSDDAGASGERDRQAGRAGLDPLDGGSGVMHG